MTARYFMIENMPPYLTTDDVENGLPVGPVVTEIAAPLIDAVELEALRDKAAQFNKVMNSGESSFEKAFSECKTMPMGNYPDPEVAWAWTGWCLARNAK